MPATARKRRFSRRRSCYLGSHSRRSVRREDEDGGEGGEGEEEEIPRELAEFILAISDPRGEKSCSRIGQRDFNVISVIKNGSVSWRSYLMKRIALKLRPSIHCIFQNITFIVALKIMSVSDDYGLESQAWNVSSIGESDCDQFAFSNRQKKRQSSFDETGTIVADAEARAVQATGSIPPVYREGGTKRKIDRQRERERDLCEGGSKQRRLPLLVYARPILIRGTSATAVYNKTNSNYAKVTEIRISVITHNQKVSSFGPLQGITPLALTQSGSEAYLAIERIQGYNLTWKRIATGFMYQEDGGSGRLSSSGRLPRHAAILIRDLEAAVVAAAGWVERLNSGMTSWLGVISHALVANGIVMRVFAERRYELATGQQRETMSVATTVAGRGFPSL
ncbi:hypothetical protein ALC56_11389 [Trachymyrmex septentrionalis]|uniref:Uncharacterized protein n=1 Tax=Trachymyrmex septentrionalis TaxID=34720 RepID=A0A195F280_9HYME|nr:hypothetical protein ALC56_11389 [Trachymyrmex septentrionalis]